MAEQPIRVSDGTSASRAPMAQYTTATAMRGESEKNCTRGDAMSKLPSAAGTQSMAIVNSTAATAKCRRQTSTAAAATIGPANATHPVTPGSAGNPMASRQIVGGTGSNAAATRSTATVLEMKSATVASLAGSAEFAFRPALDNGFADIVFTVALK